MLFDCLWFKVFPSLTTPSFSYFYDFQKPQLLIGHNLTNKYLQKSLECQFYFIFLSKIN